MTDSYHSRYDCTQCTFRNLSCKYITPEDFELVRRTSQQLLFRKGEIILKQGAKASSLVYLHKGIVKFNFENEVGKNVILTIVAGPILLGGANLFFKEINLFSLVALDDCEACLIDSKAMKKLLMNNGKYSIMMFEESTEMFKSAIFNFISLAHKQVNGRVADILLYLSSQVYKSTSFTLSFTKKEISEFAACSHENVITTLSKMNKEGIISFEGKKLEILNLPKLMEISKHG
ncbi:MAG: Crp/Fnr family transcriptional regulator [Bacteroidales bacterium]|nr:Crp/Fnr family transcriptional regulator [Bacteroidales bacterium]